MLKAGQSVKYRGMEMPATIISGPHATHGEDRWLIQKADDKVSLVKQSELSHYSDKRETVAEVLYLQLSGFNNWSMALRAARHRFLTLADSVIAALEEPKPLAKGDRIRILRDRLDSASVRAGDILTVTYVGTSSISADSKGPFPHKWSFSMRHAGTGWERVA